MSHLDPVSALVDRYLECHARCDLTGVLALFAEDAILEDPVGTPVRRGATSLRDFYQKTHRRNGRLEIERIGPVVRCGSEAAVHVRARFAQPADSPTIDVIYTLRVDASGHIASLRAYFQP